jgi:hypothetical protein
MSDYEQKIVIIIEIKHFFGIPKFFDSSNELSKKKFFSFYEHKSQAIKCLVLVLNVSQGSERYGKLFIRCKLESKAIIIKKGSKKEISLNLNDFYF